MNWKTTSVLGFLAAFTGLAYYVSTRLSTDALNMIVGVMCGMGVTIPLTIGLLIALLRKKSDEAEPEPENEFADFHPTVMQGLPRQPQTPQIIVIGPPQGQGYPNQGSYGYPQGYPYAPSMNEEIIDSRDWRIIGDDEG